MEKKTTIIYNEEEDTTYVTSTIPRDMVKLLNKYPEEYIEYTDKEEMTTGDVQIKSVALTIPGRAYNFVKAK